MKYYKFLDENNHGVYSDYDFTFYLGKVERPGKWLPKVKDLKLCERGYHACTAKNVVLWADARCFEVELRGEVIDGKDKVVAEEMRFVRRISDWNCHNLRLAAADIVEQIALPVWNEYYPENDVIRRVIDTIRRYAVGNAVIGELIAASDAARAAAHSVLGSSASVAAKAASVAASCHALDAVMDSAKLAWAATGRMATSAISCATRIAINKIVCERCGIEEE